MKISDRKDGIPGCGDRPVKSFDNEIRGHAFAARSSAATDLATSFAWVVPSFVPAAGEGMVGAMAQGEGVTKEMQRYEELIDRDEEVITRS